MYPFSWRSVWFSPGQTLEFRVVAGAEQSLMVSESAAAIQQDGEKIPRRSGPVPRGTHKQKRQGRPPAVLFIFMVKLEN
jgi:hypothetical protein